MDAKHGFTMRRVGGLAAAGVLGMVAAAAEPSTRPGWDWTLPEGLAPVPYSGFVTWNGKRFHESITVDGIHIRWKELNPAPGVFDWAPLRERIERNHRAGMRSGLHLMGVERPGVPDWVIEQFLPPVLDVPVLQDNQPWRLQIVAPWHPDVDRAFHAFLRAFGETGIARIEEVVYGYIHGISASRGEELFLRRQDVALYEREAGLTPAVFGDWLHRRLAAMLAAFRGVEYKLAWMSDGPVGPNPAYQAATADIWQTAIARGTGIRGGGIDFQHVLFHAPAWGSSISSDSHCIIDEDHPTIVGERFRGDENEEYGTHWEWRFGPVASHAYRHRIASLRGLQMRQNFQFVGPATLDLNPDLNRYVLLTQGRNRGDSPDAWAYLRECRTHRGSVRNIERWLQQRDHPGSRTVPAEPVERFPLAMDPKGQHTDWDARRTDLANGQNGILFRLDRGFWKAPGPALVKVTYVDREQTRWRLLCTAGTGETASTPDILTAGDGQLKTTTLPLPSLAASGRFPADAGFQKWLASLPPPGSNVVRNADFEAGDAHWQIPAIYRIAPDPDAPDRHCVTFTYERFDDTLHMDQNLSIVPGAAYRVRCEVRNDGAGLRPAVRLAGMDWSTILYLEASTQGAWETLEGIFQTGEADTVRLQLFGQGRGNHAPGLGGTSAFRRIVVEPVPAAALMAGREMDFRLQVDGPGDLVVTMVRIVRPE